MEKLLARLTGIFFLSVITFSSEGSASTSFQFHSELLGEETTIRVALPESYPHSTDFEYPLLLIMDGSTQFNHIAGNVEFLSTFAEIPDMIVVGVSANNRLLNFTHTKIEQFADRSGGASRYAEFLISELIPKLRDDYRVAPHTTVTGHSLSGLYTTYLAINHAESIQAAISISPSLWWDDFAILSELEKPSDQAPNVRWFASMATEPNEMAEGFERLRVKLGNIASSHLIWELQQFDGETHDSTPLVGNVMGLRSVFKGFNAVPEVDVKSLEELERYYQEYNADSEYKLPMGLHQYNVYGLKATYEGELPWGIEILEAGTKKFPHSEILWDSLATAYRINDEVSAALEASEKAVKYAEKHNSKYMSEILLQNTNLKKIRRAQ